MVSPSIPREACSSTPITVLHMLGICHGPEEFARSPIHDRVIDCLKKSRPDCEAHYIPSTDITHIDGRIVGIQSPPSRQLEHLHAAIDSAQARSRIPVGLAHSTGSIATLAALRDRTLPCAIFVSPTFLDPRKEVFDSEIFCRRLRTDQLPDARYCGMLSPKRMGYSTLFPAGHFDDPLYEHLMLSSQGCITDIVRLVREKARIFIGGNDWNAGVSEYERLFSAERICGETHSFEEDITSAERIAQAIAALVRDTVA